MKKFVVGLLVCSSLLLVGCSNDDSGSNSSSSTKESVSVKSSTENEVASTSSSVDEIAKANENWYADDSQYATMKETVKKTVDGQMEEIGVDDPVRAIVVNVIQNYLTDLDGMEHAATDINQNLEYSRMGLYINMKYDGLSPDKQLVDMISDELLRVSGHKYLID